MRNVVVRALPLLAILACGGSGGDLVGPPEEPPPVEPPPPPPPATTVIRMAFLEGSSSQTAEVTQELPSAVVVQVTKDLVATQAVETEPVAGQLVNLVVVSGGDE